MSKAAKISIFLLIFVIVAFAAFTFYTLQQNQQLTSDKNQLQTNLEAAEERDLKNMREIKGLGETIKKEKSEKADLGKKLKEANLKSDKLVREVKDITSDRDKWKRRIDKISKERDTIKASAEQLKKETVQLKAEISQKNAELARAAAKPIQSPSTANTSPRDGFATSKSSRVTLPELDPNAMEQDQYWAAVLRQKAELQVKLEQLDEELARKAIEVVELKRSNEGLSIEIDELKSQSDLLGDEIKYKSDLVNNLSLELARAKNDRKFVSGKLNKINDENAQLRRDMKSLVSAKGALQKSIVKLTQDKNKVEKELGSTENMIQSKIDEIWEIKDSLDQTFQESAHTVPISEEIELPPIHVSSQGSQVPYDLGASMPGLNGRIVSINEENNFVIVDIGKGKGIQLGGALSVYRNDKYIARLEVIQVRNDISAADIRDQWSRIQVGDIVR